MTPLFKDEDIVLSIMKIIDLEFDGDILNIIGLVDESISYMFRKFDPISRMIISRDTGMLNEYFNITKGQIIDLNFFCTMGEMENDTEETFPVETGGKIKYVPENQIKRYKSGIIDVDLDKLIEGEYED